MLASEANWKQVAKWNRQAVPGVAHYVFCCSLADVFEDWPGRLSNAQGQLLELGLQDARDQLWRLIRATPNLTWQLLTKRPDNIPKMMPAGDWPNVWLGTSLETQEYTWRLDALAEARKVIRCPVGFASAEPLLEPLDLRLCPHPDDTIACVRQPGENSPCACIPCTSGRHWINGFAWNLYPSGRYPEVPTRHCLEWVIIGGESGAQARPMHCDWARDLIQQCKQARVACFVKQLGKRPVAGRFPLALSSDPGHNAVMEDWPLDLQVQEFPALPSHQGDSDGIDLFTPQPE